MKKSVFMSLFIFFLICNNSFAFEIKGLQPVDPYGVFSTFSAESLSKGKLAVSPGAELSVHPDFYRFVLKTAYGVTDKIEVNLTVPYVLDANKQDGFEDIAIGLKHRFFDEGKYGPSLAYIINYSLPSGHEPFSTDGRYGLGLVISKRVGPVNGHVNFFYEKPGSGKFEEEMSLLAGLDFAAANNFKLLAELYCMKSHSSDKVNTIEGRFGYRIKTTDYIYTTFGAGFDFKNRTPETRVMFTVTFLYPKEEKKLKKVYEEE
jgi:hypothetical protein